MFNHLKHLTFKDIEKKYYFLRGGFNAAVYDLSETEVIRVSCTLKDGWRAMLNIPEEKREEFGLVKIKDYWFENDNQFVITVLEKLEHIQYLDIERNMFNTEKFNGFIDTPVLDDILKSDNMFYTICDKAINALDYCKANNLGVKSLDLNFLNIMQRKNGELVLTDPFGSLNPEIIFKE